MTLPADRDYRENDEMNHAPDDRRESAGNVYTNVRRRAAERPPMKPWQRALRAAAHGIAATLLLVAGTVWTLKQQKPRYVKPGDLLQLPPSLVAAAPPLSEQVFRVSSVLRRYTKDTTRANTIATALVAEGSKKGLSPSLLIGILLTENAKLDPRARSNVSARGLMQVMPFHAGKWKGCTSKDLADIASNICYGTAILADFIKRAPSLERALLNYNGCVRGTNTPNCHTYSGKVLRFADKAATQMFAVPFIPQDTVSP
ncbi:MAG: lytic transglycosylase domain-containing protein [Gemmatimonadaceae bacterium]